MSFLKRPEFVRASFVLLIPLAAALGGCGSDVAIGRDSRTGASGTSSASSSGGMAGAGGDPVTGRPLVAVFDDRTPTGSPQDDMLTVFDSMPPYLPLVEVSGLSTSQSTGTWRGIATSKDRRRLGAIEQSKPAKLHMFDENSDLLFDTVLPNPNERGYAVYPGDQAIFALTSVGKFDKGTLVKLDLNGEYIGSVYGSHGVDLVVDEERQVVWTIGFHLIRTATDLSSEQELYTFALGATCMDLDANGGIWAVELDIAGPPHRLVHFDLNGTPIPEDTMSLPGRPTAIRVDRNNGRVWLALGDAGIAYREVNGELKTIPGLMGRWLALDLDPYDASRVWGAGFTGPWETGLTGQVIHVDTSGTILHSKGGFSSSQKWIAVLLQGN